MGIVKWLLGAGVVGGGLWAWSNSASATTLSQAKQSGSIDGMVFPPMEITLPTKGTAKKPDMVVLTGPAGAPILVPRPLVVKKAKAAVKKANVAVQEQGKQSAESQTVDVTDAQAARLKLQELLNQAGPPNKETLARRLMYARQCGDSREGQFLEELAQYILREEAAAKAGQ